MTTNEVFEIFRARGLKVRLGELGIPHLRGDAKAITPRLLDVLRFHRDAIIKRLQSEAAELAKPGQAMCPDCKRKIDAKGCCWKCSYRRCRGCGCNTASCFIEKCTACYNKEADDAAARPDANGVLQAERPRPSGGDGWD